MNVHTTHAQTAQYMESQNTINMWIHRLTFVCSCLQNLILHMHIDTHSFKKLYNYVVHIHTTEAANYVKTTFTVP